MAFQPHLDITCYFAVFSTVSGQATEVRLSRFTLSGGRWYHSSTKHKQNVASWMGSGWLWQCFERQKRTGERNWGIPRADWVWKCAVFFVFFPFCRFHSRVLPGWALFVVCHQTCEKTAFALLQTLCDNCNSAAPLTVYAPPETISTLTEDKWEGGKKPKGSSSRRRYISVSHLNCFYLNLMKASYHLWKQL